MNSRVKLRLQDGNCKLEGRSAVFVQAKYKRKKEIKRNKMKRASWIGRTITEELTFG